MSRLQRLKETLRYKTQNLLDSTPVRVGIILLTMLSFAIRMVVKVALFPVKLATRVITAPFRFLYRTRPVQAVIRKTLNVLAPIFKVTRVALEVAAGLMLSLFIISSVMKLFMGSGVYKQSNLPPYRPIIAMQENHEGMEEPMIRLHDWKGEFFCSATVISDDYALTAAHCVTDKYVAQVRTREGAYTGVVAEVAGYIEVSDLALMKGDFSHFKRLMVDTTSFGLVKKKGPFYTCGFPYGENSVCFPFAPRQNYDFYVQGFGTLYPGMSGGPVLDEASGLIVAVNSRVTENASVVAPVIGLFNTLGIEVIY